MGKRRITLDIEERVLAAVDEAAGGRGDSRNRLITDAIEKMLKEMERRRIDAEFEQMGEDREYLDLLRRMESESRRPTDALWQRLEPAEVKDGPADAAG